MIIDLGDTEREANRMAGRADAFLFVMDVDREIAETLGESPLADGLLATSKPLPSTFVRSSRKNVWAPRAHISGHSASDGSQPPTNRLIDVPGLDFYLPGLFIAHGETPQDATILQEPSAHPKSTGA